MKPYGLSVTLHSYTRLQESVGVRKDSFVKRSLFASSAYASGYTSTDTPKNELNNELATLLQRYFPFQPFYVHSLSTLDIGFYYSPLNGKKTV